MNQAMAAYKRTSEVFKNASYAEQVLNAARDEDEVPGDGGQKEHR
jgi:hypothetical protein